MTATLNSIDLGTVTHEDPLESSFCKPFPLPGETSEQTSVYEPGGAVRTFEIKGFKDFDTRAELATWSIALLALNTGNQQNTVTYHSECLDVDFEVKILKIQLPWRRQRALKINYIIRLYRGSA